LLSACAPFEHHRLGGVSHAVQQLASCARARASLARRAPLLVPFGEYRHVLSAHAHRSSIIGSAVLCTRGTSLRGSCARVLRSHAARRSAMHFAPRGECALGACRVRRRAMRTPSVLFLSLRMIVSNTSGDAETPPP